jgi:hypothetical protein
MNYINRGTTESYGKATHSVVNLKFKIGTAVARMRGRVGIQERLGMLPPKELRHKGCSPMGLGHFRLRRNPCRLW